MKAILLSCPVFSTLVLSSALSVAHAQTVSAMGGQQTMQTAQQANQQAAQANQQKMQNAQNAGQNQASTDGVTRAPKFSADSGTLKAGTRVRITSPTHSATIYYTTDGWSPTTESKKYTGQIQIDQDTVLQAMAIAPSMTHSPIARAEYTVPGSSPLLPATLSTDGVLRAGTKLRLVTAIQVDSKAVQAGDKLPLQLDQDITAGDKVILAKGTTVDALVTHADQPGSTGLPGDTVFEVKALAAHGVTIPVVGPATLLAHGDEAVVKPGMTFCVTVQTDTPLLDTAAAGAGTR
ncbi:chitobiase/beta-hexosaminidase C-terminal domain-containing protein [Terracidiphilus sp.]|jgi:hypothetical protein|uniref:chitobiase/beta-hexosaminidase C-terminal domain-containing protein n=1 Tax=Terracidiphilus sp. TaxID=1964191 RepID=UPI003C226891